MAISDRLTKLSEDITSAYKSINDLGGTIPAHKNTENISVAIDSIYNRLPKVSGTGSDITLTPTLKGRLGSVLKGDTLQDGTPTPDNPIDIQCVEGIQNVKVSGKNLFDKNITPENYSYNASGVKVSDSDACINQEINNVDFSSIYISFTEKVGTAYVRICEYNSSGTFIKRTLVNSNQALTLDTNTKKLIFSVNANSTKYFTNLQIEKGSTSTSYQPYQTPQTVQIDLGDIKLYSGDKITGTPDNWSVVRENGEVVLDGSEDWMQNTVYNNVYYVENFLTDATTIEPREMISDYFTYGGLLTTGSGSVEINKFYQWTNLPQKIILGFDTTNLATFKTWLSTHNTKVVYPLATPTTTPITDTYLISQLNALYNAKSYDGQTNISVDGQLPMILEVSALKGA